MSQADLDVIRHRSTGYKLALNAPGVQDMLQDLASFCRAVRLTDSKGKVDDAEVLDPTRMAILVGRQQVWERMQHHFNLTTQELYQLYTGKPFHVTGEENNG